MKKLSVILVFLIGANLKADRMPVQAKENQIKQLYEILKEKHPEQSSSIPLIITCNYKKVINPELSALVEYKNTIELAPKAREIAVSSARRKSDGRDFSFMNFIQTFRGQEIFEDCTNATYNSRVYLVQLADKNYKYEEVINWRNIIQDPMFIKILKTFYNQINSTYSNLTSINCRRRYRFDKSDKLIISIKFPGNIISDKTNADEINGREGRWIIKGNNKRRLIKLKAVFDDNFTKEAYAFQKMKFEKLKKASLLKRISPLKTYYSRPFGIKVNVNDNKEVIVEMSGRSSPFRRGEKIINTNYRRITSIEDLKAIEKEYEKDKFILFEIEKDGKKTKTCFGNFRQHIARLLRDNKVGQQRSSFDVFLNGKNIYTTSGYKEFINSYFKNNVVKLQLKHTFVVKGSINNSVKLSKNSYDMNIPRKYQKYPHIIEIDKNSNLYKRGVRKNDIVQKLYKRIYIHRFYNKEIKNNNKLKQTK